MPEETMPSKLPKTVKYPTKSIGRVKGRIEASREHYIPKNWKRMTLTKEEQRRGIVVRYISERKVRDVYAPPVKKKNKDVQQKPCFGTTIEIWRISKDYFSLFVIRPAPLFDIERDFRTLKGAKDFMKDYMQRSVI